MAGAKSIFHTLSSADFRKITALGRLVPYRAGEIVFSEGDDADHLYLIESGRVSISIQRFNSREELSLLGPGECFGEMAVLGNDKRSATVEAVADSRLLCVDKAAFLALLAGEPEIASRIGTILAERNGELALKESLLAGCAIQGRNVQISIKGDPSLRESAFTRERYESAVDKVLDQLCPRIEDLLIHRCATEVVIHFNSGEIRIASIFDPFNPEIHPANKLIEGGYLDRHFPLVGYARKADMIRRLYRAIADDECTTDSPAHVRHIYAGVHDGWEPIAPKELGIAIAQLPTLRRIPNFYLRNVAVGITRDAIRMQFNCDGTHIVDTRDYLRFIEDNVA